MNNKQNTKQTIDRVYDLEERLLNFANNIIKLIESLPNTRSGNHIGNQLLKSGTAPYAHHGEAQAAESNSDFIHKMSIGLKELRESYRWLKLIDKSLMLKGKNELVYNMINETEELIKIFFTSIQTAKSNITKK